MKKLARYFYERVPHDRYEWAFQVYDRQFGQGCLYKDTPIATCKTREKAEQIVKALNTVDA